MTIRGPAWRKLSADLASFTATDKEHAGMLFIEKIKDEEVNDLVKGDQITASRKF